MITEEIRQRLFALQDTAYRDFQVKLIPNVDPGTVIGVRTPALRSLAREYGKTETAGDFLRDLPHRYFDENQLHAFLISGIRDFDRCMELTEGFLPYIGNLATCDQLSPKVFKKHRPELPERIREWLRSGETYTVRFAIGMLMQHFLDEDFDPVYPEAVAKIRSEEYYINMMIAWYFATALAKQYDTILPFIEGEKLDTWTHNKAIQKAVESYRITPEQKGYLKTLKIK
jgi:3-methyladenine DNA glycosylase AlkD